LSFFVVEQPNLALDLSWLSAIASQLVVQHAERSLRSGDRQVHK